MPGVFCSRAALAGKTIVAGVKILSSMMMVIMLIMRTVTRVAIVPYNMTMGRQTLTVAAIVITSVKGIRTTA